MSYFVTGGTGFIGRFLLPKLLDRGETVYLLSRKASFDKVDDLRAQLGVTKEQLVAVEGDLSKRYLGVAKAQRDKLKGIIDHFFHLAAIYDIKADAASQITANVEGTQNAMDLASTIKAGCFHHVSSIAAAGLFEGTFTEDMFDEAENLEHPYFATKHDSEGLVREKCKVPYRIYRPGIVVGHSQSGIIDKIDGPYYFFEAIRQVSSRLPKWVGAVSIAGGQVNIVPVDYVVDAMDYLAHIDGADNECFFLTHPEEISIGQLLSTMLKVSGGPKLAVAGNPPLTNRAIKAGSKLAAAIPGSGEITEALLARYGIPMEALQFVTYPTHFDSSKTQAYLEGSGISCPDYADYAENLWRFWLSDLADGRPKEDKAMRLFRNVVTDNFRGLNPKRLEKAASGRVIVVTGATSGIGHDVAAKLAAAGATVILAARTVEKLESTKEELNKLAGEVHAYSCDISDMDSCDAFVSTVLENHGHVDVLINNAGRSIRRSIELSFDRFHDFERTMQLNYFGALRLIMGFAPKMLERGRGQVINISSIGVLTSPPRFSAYVASKSALDAFSWTAAAEFAHRNVYFTTINMPLVRTPMIAPTKLYDAFPTLTPDEAADLVCKAIVDRPKRVATGLGIAGALAQNLVPNTSEYVLNQAYHLFPDSAAAKGKDGAEQDLGGNKPMDLARKAFAQILRGTHW